MVTLADAAHVAQRADPQRAAETMSEVSGTGRQALSDMRRLLGLLRDGQEMTGAVAGPRTQLDAQAFAPQPGLADLDALAERVRSTGLDVRIARSGEVYPLSGAAELTVYRIVQEALTNVLKHAASARSVRVSLSFDDPEVTVLIVDDGRSSPPLSPGASAEPHGKFSGHGLVGMTERAAAFGGTLIAGPVADGGWRVAVTLSGCLAPVPS
jgi:signal transduction histidine kinase